MASAASVTTVRATLGHILGAVEVSRTGSALSRAAKHFYVVYEIGISHLVELKIFY
jgi:hypothetical protein